jgi:alkanesulfonate monooxygenase SsuD/methylene tetrahydromethanopterin reductase-like flavin-dependent oxidoreductase (luciferase family)
MSREPIALSLVATATKRRAVLDAAAQAEARGIVGLALPGLGGCVATANSLAHTTSEITFWTSIQPIYPSHFSELAVVAAHVHELSGGRFRLGLGVSHQPMMQRLGVEIRRPLEDMNTYVQGLRSQSRFAGELPPIWLAAMRDRMLSLAAEIADGAIWANACLSDVSAQLARVPEAARDGFQRSVMIPTVISDDRAAAKAVHRKTMTAYVMMPSYRAYWKQAGYEDEMAAVESLLAEGARDRLPEAMSDRWLADITAFGTRAEVFDHFAAWRERSVLPIAVMSSTSGGQLTAVQELFDALR